MKIRHGLSVLIPLTLPAAVFALQALIPQDHYAFYFAGSLQAWLVYAGFGLIAGLAVPLCALAQGGGGLRVSGGALLAGAGLLVLSAAAISFGAGLDDDDLGWVFTQVSLALPAFGGALVTGSLAPGKAGGRRWVFRFRQCGLLLLAGLGVYAFGAVMNGFHHFMPHKFSFDNFPPFPGPDFLTMRMIRFGHVMVLMLTTPLLIPASMPAGGVRNVMRAYGLLLAAASALFIAGYALVMIRAIAVAPHFGAIPGSPVSAPFIWVQDVSPVVMDAVLVMAGMCLRLGFGRAAARRMPISPSQSSG